MFSENVRHKTALRTLQEEISCLRDELMQVKAANRKLAHQMRIVRHNVSYPVLKCLEDTELMRKGTLETIDTLLASLPALEQLRNALGSRIQTSHIQSSSSSSSSSFGPTIAATPTGTTKRVKLQAIAVNISTRPAAAGALRGGLTSLREGNEGEWQDVDDEEEDAREQNGMHEMSNEDEVESAEMLFPAVHVEHRRSTE